MKGRIDYESYHEKVKLDVKDKKILSLLAENSRTPLTQIAKKVRLSRDAVDYRIKRLEKKGIIIGFFSNLNFAKLGHYVFHVFMLLDELDKGEQEKFIEFLKKNDHVTSLIEYSDRWDLEITLIARNLLEFDKVILDIVNKFPHVILEKDKLEIIRRYNSSCVPPLLTEKGHEKELFSHVLPKEVKLDETDYKILRILSKDCRESTYKIAEQIGISADTVSYRIKSMLKEEVIRNFTIAINLSKMKYLWYTFSMEMKMFDRKNEAKFESFLDKNENILRSAKTLGGWDLLLYLVVENPREFHKIIKDIKNVFASVIRNYQTWVAYKEHMFNPMPKAIEK